MKLIIDIADFEKIKEIYDYYPVAGVTTNPTILSRSGRRPYEVLKDIRNFIGPDAQLHVQVISGKAEDMVREAAKIREILGEQTYIKVPVIREGLKAIRLLAGEGVSVTATAVYTTAQAYLAAEAGAAYVAPYVNRIDNLSQDGVQVVKNIQEILENNAYDTEVLAASFKNVRQIMELAQYGIGAATVIPDLIEELIRNDSVAAAVQGFGADFANAYGSDVTMLDD